MAVRFSASDLGAIFESLHGRHMRRRARLSLCLVTIALALASPAAAQERLYTADNFLTAAGLTPGSTVADAARIYGDDWRKMGADGIEYLAAGSLADAWMTFQPGSFVYVDCGIAPATLPDDAVSQLCNVARQSDWRQSLVRLKQMLRNGRPTAGMQTYLSADRPEPEPEQKTAAGNHGADADDDDDDDDKDFVEISRTFVGKQYTVAVEVAPMITTPAGTSRAAVIVRWKPR